MAYNQEIVYTAETSGFVASLDRAAKSSDALKRSVLTGGDAMQAKYRAVAADRARFEAQGIKYTEADQRRTIAQVNTLLMYKATAGKTTEELLRMRSTAVGISQDMQDSLLGVKESAEGASVGVASVSKSVLGLGRAVATGNIKGMATSTAMLATRLKLLGAVSLPAMGAIGAVAAAAGLAAIAFKKHHDEVAAFQRAISSTYGSLGMTAAAMKNLANSTKVAGASFGQVSEGMAAVAQTGAFTRDQLQLATQAAVQMAQDTGVKVSEAAASLARVQDDVMSWVATYQKAHHAFTAAQIEEIQNFVKQGDQAGALRKIIASLNDAHVRMASTGMEQVGFLKGAWQSLLDVARTYFDLVGGGGSGAKSYYAARANGTIQGTAVQGTAEEKPRKAAVNHLNKLVDQYLNGPGNAAYKENLRQQIVKQRGIITKIDAAAEKSQAAVSAGQTGDNHVKAQEYLKDTSHRPRSVQHAQAREQENTRYANTIATMDKNSDDYKSVTQAHNDNLRGIDEQYSDKKGGGRGKGGGGISRAARNEINGQLASNEQQMKGIDEEMKRQQEALKSARNAGDIHLEDYWKQVADVEKKALDKKIELTNQRIELAKGKGEASAYATATGQLTRLQAERAAVDTKYAGEQRAAYAAVGGQLYKYQTQLNEIARKQKDSYEKSNKQAFMSPLERSNNQRTDALKEQRQAAQASIEEKFSDPKSDKWLKQQELEALKKSYEEQEALLKAQLEKEQAMRNSVSTQIKQQILNLPGYDQTAAEAVGEAWRNTWQSSQNALNEFITTGKLNFKQFTASVLQDIAKIALQFAEMQAIKGAMNYFGGEGGGGWLKDFGSILGFAEGGAVTGPGTSRSDSVPAMLSNGEYVINAAATVKHKPLLDAINTGRALKLADGGMIGTMKAAGAGRADSANDGSNPVSVTINNQGNGNMTAQDAKDLHRDIQRIVDSRMNYMMVRQGGYGYQMRHNQI